MAASAIQDATSGRDIVLRMTHGNVTPPAIAARWQENGSTDRIDEWQLSYTTSMDANGGLQSFAGVNGPFSVF